ncbi:hypothetical protein B0H16DRAFT_1475355 [Mycena metata]|uniref:Uncharacterized protein n=1 Tax=Mycena metata TaxID=1033252 RepID=A0AAD7HEJ3_9AGAR|nr:hypothetical protein B0H16DRAFT_1475355 [Mycena metata]
MSRYLKDLRSVQRELIDVFPAASKRTTPVVAVQSPAAHASTSAIPRTDSLQRLGQSPSIFGVARREIETKVQCMTHLAAAGLTSIGAAEGPALERRGAHFALDEYLDRRREGRTRGGSGCKLACDRNRDAQGGVVRTEGDVKGEKSATASRQCLVEWFPVKQELVTQPKMTSSPHAPRYLPPLHAGSQNRARQSSLGGEHVADSRARAYSVS